MIETTFSNFSKVFTLKTFCLKILNSLLTIRKTKAKKASLILNSCKVPSYVCALAMLYFIYKCAYACIYTTNINDKFWMGKSRGDTERPLKSNFFLRYLSIFLKILRFYIIWAFEWYLYVWHWKGTLSKKKLFIHHRHYKVLF